MPVSFPYTYQFSIARTNQIIIKTVAQNGLRRFIAVKGINVIMETVPRRMVVSVRSGKVRVADWSDVHPVR